MQAGEYTINCYQSNYSVLKSDIQYATIKPLSFDKNLLPTTHIKDISH